MLLTRMVRGWCVALFFLTSAASAERMSLVFIVDGLGFGAAGYEVARTPNIDSLRDGTFDVNYFGAYSDTAIAGGVLGTPTQQPTVSGPGWSTILTGVWKDRHLVVDNGFSPRDYVNNPTYLQTLEGTVSGMQTVSIVNWAPVDTFIIGSANGTSSAIDIHQSTSNDGLVATQATARVAALQTQFPASVFVGFDDVDAAGHAGGSSSFVYKTAIENVDRRIGTILQAVKDRPTFSQEDWLFIVTADHGHLSGGGHGGQSTLERTIPFIVAGKQVEQGNLIPVLAPISHADVAPTVLDFHGVAIPDHYFGTARGQLVGTPGDLNRDEWIDVLDWEHFKATIAAPLQGISSAEAYFLGDLDGDGAHSLRDFVMFKQHYLAAGGVAADLDFALPEPATAGVVLATAWILLRSRPLWRAGRLVTRNNVRKIVPIAALMLVAAMTLSTQAAVLHVEDFESLVLGPPVEETLAGSQVWSQQGPAGWTFNRAGVPGASNPPNNNGVREWIGWNFADRDWWVAVAGDQGRSGFTKARGTIMVADPDEWDDATHPSGTYNTFATSSSISLAGADENSVMLGFDSSWLASGNQTATLRAAFDGGPAQVLFQWDSVTSSPRFKSDSPNESVVVPLRNPPGAQNVKLTWGLTNAGNDWFWGIDNIVVYYGANPNLPVLTVYTDTGEMTLTGGIVPLEIDAFEIASPGGGLDATAWLSSNLQSQQLDAVTDPAGTHPGPANDPGETWETLVASTHQIWDGFLLGSSRFDFARTETLGRGFQVGSSLRDLTFSYTASGAAPVVGTVVYAQRTASPDLNGDGSIDAADAGVMFGQWGFAGLGDLSGDGIIDAADASILFAAWTGDGAPQAVAHVLPEPTSAGVFWLLVAVCRIGSGTDRTASGRSRRRPLEAMGIMGI